MIIFYFHLSRSYIVLLHISLLSRVPISGPKFCWLIAMPGWFSCWCCPGFQVQQLPSSKGTGLVFAMLLLLHQVDTYAGIIFRACCSIYVDVTSGKASTDILVITYYCMSSTSSMPKQSPNSRIACF